MAFSGGTRVGFYEVAELLGVGGMGAVYRATDLKLKRAIAIKVLPDSLAADAERLARFQREAEILAALNHPNIAQIYGIEIAAAVEAPAINAGAELAAAPGSVPPASTPITALVMELIEGPTLAERIEQGPLPADEALNIALQICAALEAAHARGIIHRDLKPANIKLRPDGTVKVLDFGIAKALDTKTISGPQAAQLTTPAMTEAGMILGTAAYMSPEQARGKPVDQRADIWAFGCVLYEMLTGQLAFGGDDVATTLARILERSVDMATLPQSLPPNVRHTLKLCLEKDLRKRVADIRDVKLALSGAFDPGTALNSSAIMARGRVVWRTAFFAALLAAGALALPALQHLRESPAIPAPEMRVEISTPASAFPNEFALSPDGRQMAFVGGEGDEQRLWLRSLSSTTAQALAGTEGARLPFWSPDSRSIGFFSADALKRIDLAGGAPRTLAPVIAARGGSWSSDGTILFSPRVASPLMRMPASGGTVAAATNIDQQGSQNPFFLPDGKRFLFNASGIFLGTLDGQAPVRLTSSGTWSTYLPSGWMLWIQDDSLVAQRLDLERAVMVGEPLTLADGVSAISVATTGLVAYRSYTDELQLTWMDRAGTVLGTLGEPRSSYSSPRVAPDGNRVVASGVQDNPDLWLLDGARSSRLTFGNGIEDHPLWSPDGTRIAFRSTSAGKRDLYIKPANAAGTEELVVSSDEDKQPSSWSADGRFMMYNSINNEDTSADIWVQPLGGEQAAPALQTTFWEVWSSLSPDGRLMAFYSNQSGRNEVYVRTFVEPGSNSSPAPMATGEWQVSTAGGIMPLWSPDGRELYYLSPEGDMMAAPITITETTVEPGRPVALFAAHIRGGGANIQIGRQYDVAPDGRFLINRQVNAESAAPIMLIQNWNPETP